MQVGHQHARDRGEHVVAQRPDTQGFNMSDSSQFILEMNIFLLYGCPKSGFKRGCGGAHGQEGTGIQPTEAKTEINP